MSDGVMSGLGQKGTWPEIAVSPTLDSRPSPRRMCRRVRLFDQLVGTTQYFRWNLQSDLARSLQVDN